MRQYTAAYFFASYVHVEVREISLSEMVHLYNYAFMVRYWPLNFLVGNGTVRHWRMNYISNFIQHNTKNHRQIHDQVWDVTSVYQIDPGESVQSCLITNLKWTLACFPWGRNFRVVMTYWSSFKYLEAQDVTNTKKHLLLEILRGEAWTLVGPSALKLCLRRAFRRHCQHETWVYHFDSELYLFPILNFAIIDIFRVVMMCWSSQVSGSTRCHSKFGHRWTKWNEVEKRLV